MINLRSASVRMALCAVALLWLPVSVAQDALPEIHCKHFFAGYPTGTPASNDLVIRDIYALSSNDRTKFADWVAYRLDPGTVSGEVDTFRKWRQDPFLEDDETLHPDDYKNASAELTVDRGHQAPLASFKGTGSWQKTNYLSNITPQKKDLNQGPWKRLEDAVREIVYLERLVWIFTGPLYESTMPQLPEAGSKPHQIPSGYWKIVLVGKETRANSIRAAAFIFGQDTPRSDAVIDHLTTIDEIEERSGLDFLRLLTVDEQADIEADDFEEWATEHFDV